jgi:hypothetical protein
VDRAKACLVARKVLADDGFAASRVNTSRCLEILELGRLRGLEPAEDAWEQLLGGGSGSDIQTTW